MHQRSKKPSLLLKKILKDSEVEEEELGEEDSSTEVEVGGQVQDKVLQSQDLPKVTFNASTVKNLGIINQNVGIMINQQTL